MKRAGNKTIKRIATCILCVSFALTGLYVPQISAEAAQRSRLYNFNTSYYLTGNGADDVVAVALAQEWKTQSQLGYPRYWCADFASDCAQAANLGNIIPGSSSCKELHDNILARGGSEVSSPQKGDYIFYYCPDEWLPYQHVGIMINSTTSIEGNRSNKVQKGYGSYTDGSGHTVKSGHVRVIYVRPNYGNTPEGPLSGFTADGAGEYIVTTNSLPLTLRSTPSQSGSQLALLPKGTQVHVDMTNGQSSSSWAYATYNGQKGFLSMMYLTKVEQESLPETEIEYWLSDSAMGNVVSSAKSIQTVYFCYKITRKDNGNLVDVGDYNVKQTVYFPDGTSWDNNYQNSNNNWIRFTTSKSGNYTCKLELSGDWTATVTKTLYNVPDGTEANSHSWFSASEMGSKITELEKGRQYYYCMKTTNKDGVLLNAAIARDTSMKMEVKAPDGSLAAAVSKTNTDHYSLKFTASQTGTYRGNFVFTVDGATGQNDGADNAECKAKQEDNIVLTYYAGDNAEFPVYTDVELADVQQVSYPSSKKGTYVTVLTKEPEKYVTISFDVNGGDSSLSDTKIQQKLLKWEDESGNTYKPGDKVKLTKSMKLFATYSPASLSNLPTITRNGYTFDGWYTASGTNVKGKNTISDMTVIAHWVKSDVDDGRSDTGTTDNTTGYDENSNSSSDDSDDSDTFDVDTEGEESEDDEDVVSIGDELTDGDVKYTVTSVGNTKTVEYTESEEDAKKVTIPATITIDGNTYAVTSIGEKAFYKNTAMTAVSIGTNITEIGSKAFYGCSKLKQIVVNSTKIASIGKNAFKKVPKTVKVLLPKSKYASYKKILKKEGISVKAKYKKIK